jgi:hypothetical protein
MNYANCRWLMSLHESAHGVTAIALGGRCCGAAILDDGLNGLCQTDELLGDREMWMVAAGPAAERLAAEYPIPDVEIDQTTISAEQIENLPVFATAPTIACQMARTSDMRQQYASDDRRLALWAISGHESEPDTWLRRVEFARQMAAELIERNAAAIVAVATKLFEKSSLSENEIKSLLTERNHDILTTRPERVASAKRS